MLLQPQMKAALNRALQVRSASQGGWWEMGSWHFPFQGLSHSGAPASAPMKTVCHMVSLTWLVLSPAGQSPSRCCLGVQLHWFDRVDED